MVKLLVLFLFFFRVSLPDMSIDVSERMFVKIRNILVMYVSILTHVFLAVAVIACKI